AACEADGDIVVFITQDVIIRDNRWLEKLVAPIVGGEAEACFSRQLCENSSIEKYIREKNYPAESRVVTKNDIKALGLGTFFFSDVSSAMERKMFLELNGYDRKDLITNEDMYICHKLITNGYRVKYCADSVVVHSHTFTFMQLLRRYFDTGVFMKQNEYFLQYGANKSGLGLLKYVLKRAFEEKNLRVALTAIPNFAARFIGMALGKRYNVLSRKVNIFLASNKSYWLSQDC
ncbi:MAG: rhamnosyltransferase, partial [Bacillota bacterium]|nr:rhamnosyltransferase [Bacillota bacterium]